MYYARLKEVFAKNPNLPRAYRDSVLDKRFLGMLDFLDSYTYSGPLGTLPVGTSLKEMPYDKPPATVLVPLLMNAKGLEFSRNTGRLVLGENWRLPPNTPHFAICFWLNLDTTGYTSTGTGDGFYSIGGLRHAALGTSSGYQWFVYFNADRTTGQIKNLSFIANGKTVSVPYPGPGLRQFVFEYLVVGSTHMTRIYEGSTLLAASAPSAQSYITPDPSDLPTLGQWINTYPANPKGLLPRCWIVLLDQDGASLAALVAKDRADNLDRIS